MLNMIEYIQNNLIVFILIIVAVIISLLLLYLLKKKLNSNAKKAEAKKLDIIIHNEKEDLIPGHAETHSDNEQKNIK